MAQNQNKPDQQSFEYQELQPGDYFLHAYIEETRGLVSPSGTSSTIDPLLKISAFGQRQTTRSKDDRGTGHIYWGEHFFFEKKFTDFHEIELEKIKIQVIDYNIVGFNSLVGEYEFDLAQIYQQKQHAYLHQWIALSNIKADYENIKVSLNLVGKGDKQVILKDEPLVDSEASNLEVKISDQQDNSTITKSHILLPPSIKTQSKLFCVILLIILEKLIK